MTPEQRKMLILSLAVERFIETGEPVGSKFLADAMGNTVSSATIRNDMAILENLNYLEQPHASAGRIPTHRGYRAYINGLMQVSPLTYEEAANIDALFNIRNADPDKLLEDAARSLSQLTGLATVTTTVIPKTVTVKQVEIIPAGRRTAVILLVASSGVIKNKVCRVDYDLTENIIDFFVKFTHSFLCTRSLDEITSAYLSSVSVSLGEYSRIFTPVLMAIFELVREINEGQYYFKGGTNLLKYDELNNSAYELLSFIEEKNELIKLFSNSNDPMTVMIGRESVTTPLSDSSLLIARYHIGDSAVGAIGLIGPTRMDYKRLLPHLEYFANTLGKLLSETYMEQ